MTPEEQQETLAMIQAELESSTRVSIATDIRIIRIAAQVATGALLLIAGAMLSNAAPIESVPLPQQHWYTMDVPTPEGVFPVEVYAPALPRIVASDLEPIYVLGNPPRLVDVPELGPRAPLGIGLGCLVGYVYFTRKAQKKAKRHENYLYHLMHNGDDYSKEIAREALEGE